jgi:hypothetical protein
VVGADPDRQNEDLLEVIDLADEENERTNVDNNQIENEF